MLLWSSVLGQAPLLQPYLLATVSSPSPIDGVHLYQVSGTSVCPCVHVCVHPW